jgi:vitamin B12 transporter
MRYATALATLLLLASPIRLMAQTLSPPKLTHFEPALSPSPAPQGRSAGKVVLTLEVDRAGRVISASVFEGLDAERDAAAVAAAQRLAFEPALRDGVPIGARLRFAYDFPAEPAPVVESAPKAPTAVAPAPAGPPPPQASPPATQIVVVGASKADRVRQSAQAVEVLELEHAQRQSADLGEVMSRSRGVTVQRAGGLGSEARFALNGLEGEQIRFFLDGVPLDYAGFAFGFANVPVNLVQRVEVYRGVVPTRYGADALGGAVDLVTDEKLRSMAGFSYQAGSFDTHRVTAQATALQDRGLFVRTNAFFDTTRNDYLVDVLIPDRDGREAPVRVRRFHDGYRGHGLAVEGGRADPRKDRWLSVRAHYAASEKELQHGTTMVVPYGEVERRSRAAGAHVRYRERLLPRLSLNAVAGYAFGTTSFRDVATCVYNWFGQCAVERPLGGEIESGGRDLATSSHAVFLRATGEWRIAREQRVRLSVAPEAVWRTIDERRLGTFTGLSATEGAQRLETAVSGVEHQLDALDDRLQNVLFGKSYLQRARFSHRLPNGSEEQLNRSTSEWGLGDALRFRFTPELWAKLSYEYATRLPSADEVFGDGALTQANLQLLPELSHNLNLGLAGELKSARAGALRGELNGFLRETSDLIRRTGAALYYSHDNVAEARTVGVEVAARFAIPQDYLALDVAATLQDSRNRSSSGPYAAQRGDRIPNRPYAFGNATLTARVPDLVVSGDALTFSWNSRYVHEFFRTWESLGARASKPTIASQLVHTAGATYEVLGQQRLLASTIELQNLSDEATYDFFGVQRPGRAAFFKCMLQI